MNELNTRQLQSGNKSEIKQDSVLKEARKISDYADRCDAMQRIFDNSGAWVSFDEEQGIRGCVMGPGYRSIAFSSPMTIIGHGTAVANESMNRHFVSRMDLTARRQGFSMTEGLHHALLIATETQQKTNKMGGDFQIQLINMKADKPEDRLREICDDRSRLAMEILTAELENQIDEATATELTAALLLENQLPEMVENTLFERAKSAEALFLHLAGFRRTVQDLVPTVTTEKGSQS
jgi:hypothetical protein